MKLKIQQKWSLPILVGIGLLQAAGIAKAEVTSNYKFSGKFWVTLQYKPSNGCISSTESVTAMGLDNLPDVYMVPLHTIGQIVSPLVQKAENVVLHHLEIPIPIDETEEIPVSRKGNNITFVINHQTSLSLLNHNLVDFDISIPMAGVIDPTNGHITLSARGANIGITADDNQLQVSQIKGVPAIGHADHQDFSNPLTSKIASTAEGLAHSFIVNGVLKKVSSTASSCLGCLSSSGKQIGVASVHLSSWTLTPVSPSKKVKKTNIVESLQQPSIIEVLPNEKGKEKVNESKEPTVETTTQK